MSADGPQADHVEDQDGHLKQRRLNDIHEARRRVHNVINKVEESKLMNNVSEQDANTYIRRSIENYIREIRYPLKNTEEGKEYWEEETIGTLEIEPPPAAQIAWRHKLSNGIGHPRPGRRDLSSMPAEYTLRSDPSELDAKSIGFKGLKSLFEAPNPIKTTYSLRFSVRFRDEITVNQTMEKQIPRTLLLRFFDVAIDASGAVGLEADLDNGNEEVKFGKEHIEAARDVEIQNE